MMHNLGRMLSIYYFPEETKEIRKLMELGASDEEQTSVGRWEKSQSRFGGSWASPR